MHRGKIRGDDETRPVFYWQDVGLTSIFLYKLLGWMMFLNFRMKELIGWEL